jgi:hypothetical protein
MTLTEHHVSGNDVRVPKPAEGEAVVVGHYGFDRPKAVILHPRDYALLRETAALIGELDLASETFSPDALQARELEDRPRDELLVEDSARIAELLEL